MTDQIEHPLWQRLRNWRDWQIILEGVKLGKTPQTHDNEGMIEVKDLHDAEFVIEPVLAAYKMDEPKKYNLIVSYLLNRDLIIQDHAKQLGINPRTWRRWRVSAVKAIQERVDRFEKGNRRPRGKR